MLTPERSGLLKSFLSGLPEQIAQRLAQAVEIDRLIDGKTLPHEMILESLRPALRRTVGHDRTPTPLRAFCIPFEDLFTLLPRKAKQRRADLELGQPEPVAGRNQSLCRQIPLAGAGQQTCRSDGTCGDVLAGGGRSDPARTVERRRREDGAYHLGRAIGG
jgi:hypothetical protein